VPVDEGARQVTCAAYPAAWAEAADVEDEAGGSIQSLLDRLPHREVAPAEWAAWGEDGRSWYSVDTPEAAAAALGRYGGSAPVTPAGPGDGSPPRRGSRATA
jgi:hypothetical protein